ncbi:DUF4435 domain-containing protein [Paracoccus sp. SCSIO 75233]|uniref:DUF4435 domain-containing protein n=1 Tax=Paracoccus sp. SCSIO 75233 TaxID=3017782 RepID=UPI0022F1061E|nr:DUF4435 domain-containing protein [Paracoccus sp. SCSIO 75233]WBU53886.1 DUF4435 domain-containing protein [Paracoccus sp. SCSIO 75233]
MFTRSKQGIENEHLFYNVDFVVYCEGKKVDGEGSSLDEVFWQRVFSENGLSVHCRSYGSKSEVMPLAEKIISEEISHVLVAMDRDYDDMRGISINHPKVFYTYGYSWESDVIADFQFAAALSLFATTNRRQIIKNELHVFRNNLSHKLKRVCALDFKYIGHKDKLFDRLKPMSIISTSANQEPHVKTSALLDKAKKMGSFQTGALPAATYRALCGVRTFFGKVVSRLIFHWFAYRTKRINGSRKVKYEMFMNLLSSTLDMKSLNVPRNQYYSALVSRL